MRYEVSYLVLFNKRSVIHLYKYHIDLELPGEDDEFDALTRLSAKALHHSNPVVKLKCV